MSHQRQQRGGNNHASPSGHQHQHHQQQQQQQQHPSQVPTVEVEGPSGSPKAVRFRSPQTSGTAPKFDWEAKAAPEKPILSRTSSQLSEDAYSGPGRRGAGGRVSRDTSFEKTRGGASRYVQGGRHFGGGARVGRESSSNVTTHSNTQHANWQAALSPSASKVPPAPGREDSAAAAQNQELKTMNLLRTGGPAVDKNHMVRDFVDEQPAALDDNKQQAEGADNGAAAAAAVGAGAASSENVSPQQQQQRRTVGFEEVPPAVTDVDDIDALRPDTGSQLDGGSPLGSDAGASKAALARRNSMGSAEGSSLGGSSDEDGDQSGISGSTGTSASSNGKRIRDIKTRPMTTYVLLCFCVPLIFLIAYQSQNVGVAVSIHDWMSKHAPVADRMQTLQTALREEILFTSELIGNRIAYGVDAESLSAKLTERSTELETREAVRESLPAWALNFFYNDTLESIRLQRESYRLLLDVIDAANPDSSGTELPHFHSIAVGLPDILTKAVVAANRNNFAAYRDEIIEIMQQLSVLYVRLQKHDGMRRFTDLTDMQVLTKLQQLLASVYSDYTAVEHEHNSSIAPFHNASLDHSNDCVAITAGWAQLTGFVEYMETGSHTSEVEKLAHRLHTRIKSHADDTTQYDGADIRHFVHAMEPFVQCHFDHLDAWYSNKLLHDTYHGLEKELSKYAEQLMSDFRDNAKATDYALGEGMKMMGAMIAVIIVAVILVYLLTHEKNDLLKIIDHSQELADAVQLFLPKKQLRLLGLRSVTEIEKGLATEVSICMQFADIRSFSTVSERMPNMLLFEWLALYVQRMTEAAGRANGTVSSFLGDGLMLYYNTAREGVYGSIALQQEVDHINLETISQGQDTDLEVIRVGVGLHHGLVVLGVFGDDTRLSCSFVSSSVNTSARLEGLTKIWGTRIIMSRDVVDQLSGDDGFEIRRLGTVYTAGSNHNLEIYDCYQADHNDVKQYKNETLDAFHRAVELTESTEKHDRDEALNIIIRLERRAKELRVHDAALYILMKEARRSDEKWGAGPVRIDKDILERAEAGESVSFS